jgi:isopenicillin-N epimerase
MKTESIGLPRRSPLRSHWSLDPAIVFLNHGSFGACPTSVLGIQDELRTRMETEPVRFFIRELPDLLDAARTRLAAFLRADSDGLAFVTNATTGVNTALAAIPFEEGDEILVTDHGYPACHNAAEAAARRTGARVVEVPLAFPVSSSEEVVETVIQGLSPRTRAAIIDHVTSPTGLVFPIELIAAELENRGVTVIVDGAHAPGMLDLDLAAIGAPFYTGNCHKWLCAPKGAAFLHVRDDWRARTHPLVTSHGAAAPLVDRSRFRLEFDWTGTGDPTPWLAVPAAIDAVGSMVPGGWTEVRLRNRRLTLDALDHLCSILGLNPPCPKVMIGSLAAIPLPSLDSGQPLPMGGMDPLQERLYHEFSIEVPITLWSNSRRRAVRFSAHLYNTIEEFSHLGAGLAASPLVDRGCRSCRFVVE